MAVPKCEVPKRWCRDDTKVCCVQLNAHAERPVGSDPTSLNFMLSGLYSAVFAISKLQRKACRAQTAWRRKRGSHPCS